MFLILPGALTVYLAFNSGGYFAGSTAVASLVVIAAVALRMILSDEPLAGLNRSLALAAGALMLYAVWVLLSGGWSDSSARALVEFNRALLYLGVLVLFGTMSHSPERLRRMLWGLAAAFTVICAAGLLTRLYPDVFTLAPAIQNERLNYPIGYWSALGLIAALGIVLCLHLASSEREPAPARVLGAAALPVLASTLLFTFSRGPLAAAVLGVVGYAVIARPRALLSGVLAAGPATALALVASYRADLLSTREPTTAAAAAQGHDVALVVAACILFAAGLRALLLWLDPRLAGVRLEQTTRRRLVAAGVVIAVAAGAFVVAGTDLPDRLREQQKRFTRSDLGQTGDNRDRLTDPGINRFDHWNISLDAFRNQRLRGEGAGTFALLWDRDRPDFSESEEGHSLYLETLGELGLVGMVLLAIALVALLAGVARRARGPNRPLYAAVLVVGLVWALHAGIDWDWEIPGVTLWLFALTAQAGASAPAWRPSSAADEGSTPPGPSVRARALLAGVCLALAATPALVAVSQARLTQSVEAYRRGVCSEAVTRARSSLDAVGNRPEPYEVIAYCELLLGSPAAAEEAMRAAVERDPNAWEYHYGLALIRGARGRDPRRQARLALRLNPKEARTRLAVSRLHGDNPRRWRTEVEKLGVRLSPGG